MSQVKIILNGEEIEAVAGSCLIEAAKVAGCEIPHYCYHAGLSIAGSCRLCAVEVGQRDEAGDVKMGAKLVMSCELTVREGMVVETESEKVILHRKENMEFLLINHPLDCPVCDQAGECFLQDYSFENGWATGHFNEDKIKQSKKQVGENIYLYGDRCIMCSRCVRFTREISGGAELMVNDRGNQSEIDIFPGIGVNDNMAGNVVDLCPVGALLDKQFLFKQRVWDLKGTESICPGCSRGCSITIDHNKGVVYRIRPRYNAEVNQWWMCDDGRYGFKFVQADERLSSCLVRQDEAVYEVGWEEAIASGHDLLDLYGQEQGGKLAVVLSSWASLEEQWVLAQWARQLSSETVLVSGPIFTQGEDERFKSGFVVKSEKVPNRKGMEQVLELAGGAQKRLDELAELIERGEIEAVMVQGGPRWQGWCPEELVLKLRKAKVLVVLDILESELSRRADVVFAGAAWAEKAGSFVNDMGLCQRFEKAVDSPGGGVDDLTYLWHLSRREGTCEIGQVRREMFDEKGQLRRWEEKTLGVETV